MNIEYVSHERAPELPAGGVDIMEELNTCTVTLRLSLRTLRLISAMGKVHTMKSEDKQWAGECARLASAVDTIQDRLQKVPAGDPA